MKKAIWDHEQLTQLKNNLNHILNDDDDEPSIFTQAALLWNGLALWEKIALGVVLVAPTFFLGILVHATILLTLSVVTVVLFSLSSYLFDNHTKKTHRKETRLRQKIFGLADVLSGEIELLHSLHEDLSQEIDALHAENDTLSEQNELLADEVSRLKETIDQLKQAQSQLETVASELETTKSTLQINIDKQSLLLQATQEQLEFALHENNHQIALLDEQIKAIDGMNQSLSKELKAARYVALTLNDTLSTFSASVVVNREKFDALFKKIDDLFDGKSGGLANIAERLDMSQQKLEQAAGKFNEHNNSYRENLERHLKSIEMLESFERFKYEQLIAQCSPAERARALSVFGIYAQPSSKSNQDVSPLQTESLNSVNFS